MNEIEQFHFDRLLPRKEMLRVRDLVLSLGLSESTVEKLCDTGQLPCLRINAGSGRRMTRMLPRDGVILFLLQARDYEPADYLAGVIGLLGKLSLPGLRIVHEQLPKLIEAAGATAKPPGKINLNLALKKHT